MLQRFTGPEREALDFCSFLGLTLKALLRLELEGMDFVRSDAKTREAFGSAKRLLFPVKGKDGPARAGAAFTPMHPVFLAYVRKYGVPKIYGGLPALEEILNGAPE
jgi:hypothetical protein